MPQRTPKHNAQASTGPASTGALHPGDNAQVRLANARKHLSNLPDPRCPAPLSGADEAQLNKAKNQALKLKNALSGNPGLPHFSVRIRDAWDRRS